MANTILELIKKEGETNPTQIYIIGKTFDYFTEDVTYEDVDKTFAYLYEMDKIEQVGNVNYRVA